MHAFLSCTLNLEANEFVIGQLAECFNATRLLAAALCHIINHSYGLPLRVCFTVSVSVCLYVYVCLTLTDQEQLRFTCLMGLPGSC